MATEKLEINARLKNKTWTNPQIKNHKNSHEIRLIRQQSRHKNPQHLYLKFLAQLIQSV